MPRPLPLSYCADLVRKHDYDRYLCTLFAPASVREAWFVLFAFHCEIAAITEKVSEAMTGLLRLAWWQERLDEIYAGKVLQGHPVAEALAKVIAEHSLPQESFDQLLAAHEQDLQREPFASLEELESYCRDTSAALLRLCALCAGLEPWTGLDDLGIAWGQIQYLHETTRDNRAAICEVVAQHTKHAQAHTPLPGMFLPFLQTCEFYLKRSHRPRSSIDHVRLIITLWWKNITRKK